MSWNYCDFDAIPYATGSEPRDVGGSRRASEVAKPMTPHRESHFINRIGWLRPAVLGANDGIVSTASLILGVAAASADRHAVLVAGVAGLAAGAMSMAAGEYVSVSSQADTEAAGLAKDGLSVSA